MEGTEGKEGRAERVSERQLPGTTAAGRNSMYVTSHSFMRPVEGVFQEIHQKAGIGVYECRITMWYT